MNLNIVLCGVGGQGTLLAGNVIAEAAMRSNFDVKKSEVHGMAQRGGSVVSHVRLGDCIYSPLIRKGEADIILAFEELEALRQVEFVKPEGMVIVNAQKIIPMTVSAGSEVYPEKICSILQGCVKEVCVVDAIGHAIKLGNAKCLNVILLGVLARKIKIIPEETWKEVLAKKVPSKLLELNLKAFQVGWEMV